MTRQGIFPMAQEGSFAMPRRAFFAITRRGSFAMTRRGFFAITRRGLCERDALYRPTARLNPVARWRRPPHSRRSLPPHCAAQPRRAMAKTAPLATLSTALPRGSIPSRDGEDRPTRDALFRPTARLNPVARWRRPPHSRRSLPPYRAAQPRRAVAKTAPLATLSTALLRCSTPSRDGEDRPTRDALFRPTARLNPVARWRRPPPLATLSSALLRGSTPSRGGEDRPTRNALHRLQSHLHLLPTLMISRSQPCLSGD